jgi:hypothetical protein
VASEANMGEGHVSRKGKRGLLPLVFCTTNIDIHYFSPALMSGGVVHGERIHPR